jgi:hypothetical protein
MNQLSVDPASGFLESSSPNLQTFDANKKQEFIKLALEQAKRGEWPDIEDLCDKFGMTSRTFYGHKKQDGAFSDAWEDVKRAVVHDIAKTMHTHSKRPGNYMDRVTLLRHLYPEDWGGIAKDQSFQDFSFIKKLNDVLNGSKPAVIDAELVNTSTPKASDAL